MTYKIPGWISFTGGQEKNDIFCCTECPVKQQLKELAERYLIDSKELLKREEDLVSQFGLDEDEKRYVHYGIITPFNLSYKKFTDILNNDIYLNKLAEDIKTVLLEGNLLIIHLLKNKGINPPGYNIDAYIENPHNYYQEIHNLVLSLSGYEHIHLHNDLLLFELPARIYIEGCPEIKELVDHWITGLEIFI